MAARPRPSPQRALAVLLAGAVLASTGYLLVITVTPVLAGRFLSRSAWIGLPNAALVLGVAAGAPVISWFIPRLGRPTALASGFFVAALAALAPAAAVARGDGFWLFLGGSLLLGAGYSAYHLTRYAAALLVPPSRSGRAIGLVVWVAVVGSFAAPVLFDRIEQLAASRNGDPAPLVYLAAALLFALTGLLFHRSRSLRALRSLRAGGRPAAPAPGAADTGRTPFGLAVLSMASAQGGMIMLMAMTPVQVVAAGGSLTGLGAIMGAHTLGMFALSPVVGALCDRLGERTVIALGGAAVVAAGVLAARADGVGVALGAALCLLGLGWCLAFIAASALLAKGPGEVGKVRRQGLADALNWFVAALASVGSGVVMTGLGFPAVSLVCAAIGVLTLGAAAAMPRRSSATAPPSGRGNGPAG